VWEGAWVSFRQNTLKSEGGIISSGNADGWGVDEKSFIGVFRFMNLETAQKFFAEAQMIIRDRYRAWVDCRICRNSRMGRCRGILSL